MSTAQNLALVDQLLQPFYQQNPSIHVKLILSNGPTTETGLLTGAAAGTNPDVFHTWVVPTAQLENNILLDLMPYASKDNVDLSIFSSQQIGQLRAGSGLFGLPMYLGTVTVLINKSMLDSMGIAYPAQDWTYADWAQLASATTKKNATGTATHGIDNISMQYMDEWQFQAFGGSILNPADPTQCTLDAPGSIAATRWYADLFASGAAIHAKTLFFQGQSFSRLAQSWELDFWLASLYRSGVDWDIMSLPTNPGYPGVTRSTSDYYGVSAATKHGKESWELVRYMGTAPAFAEGLIKTRLFTPALKSLWPQFVTIINQVAPFTRGKNMAVRHAGGEQPRHPEPGISVRHRPGDGPHQYGHEQHPDREGGRHPVAAAVGRTDQRHATGRRAGGRRSRQQHQGLPGARCGGRDGAGRPVTRGAAWWPPHRGGHRATPPGPV